MTTSILIAIAVTGLTILLVAFDTGSERSQTPMRDAGAWSTIDAEPVLLPPVLDYEAGYMDGYEDARNGASFGGDK